MAKKEILTDLWVYDMLKETGVQNKFSAQGSNIKEIYFHLIDTRIELVLLLDVL